MTDLADAELRLFLFPKFYFCFILDGYIINPVARERQDKSVKLNKIKI